MKYRIGRQPPRLLAVAAVAAATALTMLGGAIPASAHTPIRLDRGDVLPWQAPLVLNGESPVMLFGTLDRPWAVRSAQLHMTAGQHLVLNLAIPNEAPENLLTNAELPVALVISPDLTVVTVRPALRIPIQTDSGQSLLVLQAYSTVAIAGDYSVVLTGANPARFAVASGLEGLPFAGVTRGRIASDSAVADWYATPPPSRHDDHQQEPRGAAGRIAG